MSQHKAFRIYLLIFGLLALIVAAYWIWPATIWTYRETYSGLRWNSEDSDVEPVPCTLTLEGKRSLSGQFSGTLAVVTQGEGTEVREECVGMGLGKNQVLTLSRFLRLEASNGKVTTTPQLVGVLFTNQEDEGLFTFSFLEGDPAYEEGIVYSGPAGTLIEAQEADQLARE